MMAHSQKPGFVFRLFKLAGGCQFSRLLTTEVCGIGGSNAGYTMFRGSVKCTSYPFHSPVSPSLPFPCVTVCHHISTGVYHCEISVGCLHRPIPPLDNRHSTHWRPKVQPQLLGQAGKVLPDKYSLKFDKQTN